MSPPGSSASDLLHRFAVSRCGEAFRELVKRYSGFVMAVARRQTAGDEQAAEDLVQEVFSGLAREAKKVRGETLGAWLHRRTVFAAGHWRRGEQRRRHRETTAVEMQETSDSPRTPVPEGFDEAFAKLREEDQQVLLWRYVEEWDYRTIGVRTGVSEDAAQKRAARALEQLRTALVKRGALHSRSALAALMVAVAGKETVSAAQQAKWAAAAALGAGDVSWTVAGIVLPAACLVAGVALPVLTMRQDRQAPEPAQPATSGEVVSATTIQEDRPDAAPIPTDLAGLLALTEKAQKSGLWAARLDRAVHRLSVAGCRQLMEEIGYVRDNSGQAHRGLYPLREKIVAHWSDKAPEDAVKYLRDVTEIQVAFRALGAKDIAAAEQAAAVAVPPESTDPDSHRSTCWMAAVYGLAAKDLDAAIAIRYAGAERLNLPNIKYLHEYMCNDIVKSTPAAAARLLAKPGTEVDHYYRSEALRNLAKTDAKLALSMLREVPVPAKERREVENSIFENLVKQDGLAAMRAAPELLGERAAGRASWIAQETCRNGCEQAWAEAEKCEAGAFREALLREVGMKLARHSPKEALAKFHADDASTSGPWWEALTALAGTNAEAVLELKVPDKALPQGVAVNVAMALARHDAGKAQQWLDSLPEAFKKEAAEAAKNMQAFAAGNDPAIQAKKLAAQSDVPGKVAGLSASITKWYTQDPGAAAEFAEGLKGEDRLGAQAGIVTAAHVRSPSQLAGAQHMIEEWKDHPGPLPDAALQAVSAFTRSWGKEDAGAASGWIDTLPRGPLFDSAAGGFSETAALTDPREALAWAAAIGDEMWRNGRANWVLQDWSMADPDDARAAVTALNAPAAVKAAFSKYIRAAQ